MTRQETDFVVIGGGPGGYVGAIRASQLGADVTLVEKGSLGGTCVNWGCIPTKTLLKTCELAYGVSEAEKLGLVCSGCEVNLEKLRQRKEHVITRSVRGIAYLMKKNKVEVVQGHGRLTSQNTLLVSNEEGQEQEIKANHILLATGSRPALIPLKNIENGDLWTNREALELSEVPDRLLVIGAGAIGAELSHVYRILGSNVTVVEMMPHIIPGEDVEVTEVLRKLMRKKGIEILTDSRLQDVRADAAGYTASIQTPEGSEQLGFDKVLVCVGRRPNSQDLGLEEVGVETDGKGFVRVNERMQTNQTSVLAIGDLIGGQLLAHTASREAEVAVENALGISSSLRYDAVPRFVASIPDIAGVGLTEAEAVQQGKPVKVGKFPFSANAKARIEGEESGFVKLVSHAETGEILGMQAIGVNATDLILEGLVLVSKRLKVKDIIEAVHHHPSLGEAIHEAALDVENRTIHI